MRLFSSALVGLYLCLYVPGCGKQGESNPPRVDTLSVERDQLLMIHHLPLGLSHSEVRLRFPSMGEIRNASVPGQALTGTVSGTMRVMDGREARVEMMFENDTLASYALLVPGDSLFGAITYERVRMFYTMQFGNYHQELREDGRRRLMRSYWTSDAFAVVVVLFDSSDLHTVQWGFENLPAVNNEQPEADATHSYHHVPLAVLEE